MTSDSRKNSNPSARSLQVDLGREAERMESLAALLDGDLESGRRAEILASLDGDDLDLLSEVDALMGEIAEVSFDVEGDEGGSPEAEPSSVDDLADEDATDEVPEDGVPEDGVPPDNVVRGPWSRRAWATVTTLAAVVALAVVAPRVFLPDPPTPQMMVAGVDVSQVAEATAKPFWSPTRGGGTGDPVIEALGARDSFRLGVLATDLEVALESRNQKRLESLELDFHRVLEGSPLLTFYLPLIDAAMTPEESLALHRDLQESVPVFVEEFFYRYGLWVRAAWLAAESGELDFFRGSAPRTLGGLQPPGEELEEEIRLLRQQVRGVHSEADLLGLAEELASIADEHAH